MSLQALAGKGHFISAMKVGGLSPKYGSVMFDPEMCVKSERLWAVHFSHAAMRVANKPIDGRAGIAAGALGAWSEKCNGRSYKFAIRNSMGSTITDELAKSLWRLPDPQSVQHKEVGRVPRLLHIVAIQTGENPPLYWAPVQGFTKELSASQGFDVKVWTISDVEDLMNDRYSNLKEGWERIKGTGEGARIADFVRLLAVHARGGVYLDLDMIPCAGLEELTKAGFASFPFTQPPAGQVSNNAFAAPPGHPVLRKAIELIVNNPRSHLDHILDSTGPPVLAHAVQIYNEENNLSLPNVYKKDNMPPEPFKWTTSGDVRLGTFREIGHRDPNGFMNLYHLTFASWMPDRNRAPFRSKCETDLDLIVPFIKEQCNANLQVEFSNCGKAKNEE
jgi:hypothetical protein